MQEGMWQLGTTVNLQSMRSPRFVVRKYSKSRTVSVLCPWHSQDIKCLQEDGERSVAGMISLEDVKWETGGQGGKKTLFVIKLTNSEAWNATLCAPRDH